MLSSVVWRCARRFVVFLPLVLFTGHAAGQSPRCLDPSAAPTPAFAVEPTQTPTTALETSIWKTITVGGSKGVNAIRAAIETAPCSIWFSEEADEILGRPAFPFIKAPVELDLVVLSVSELGFGNPASSDDAELGASVQVSLRDIYVRAVSLGFELCPAEVGPALRLDYLDQPLGEFLHIAMKPVARYTGELVNFVIGGGGLGLLLVGGNGDPDVIQPGVVSFVFVRPKPIAQNDPSPKR
jgi:hypothetical protein